MTSAPDRRDDLRRIRDGLRRAMAALAPFTSGSVASKAKPGGDPVTAADQAVNEVLAATLPRSGEGWLSEETADDARRLEFSRVWVVDPVDGTREFIAGIPEWCVSIGLVEDGVPVAGGICNPAAGDTVLGAEGIGVVHNDRPVMLMQAPGLTGATVLASRSEVERGEWERFAGSDFAVRPMGSVAYKLARVAAGLEQATWTLTPKHEWDVAAGCALVAAAGGLAVGLDGRPPPFNGPGTKLEGLVACAPGMAAEVLALLGI